MKDRPRLPIFLVIGSGALLALGLGGWRLLQTSNQATPTYSRDVAKIVFEKCSRCHRPGQTAPFSLLTYADFKKRDSQIAKVIESRFMPPWLPEPMAVPLADDLSLSDVQRATILDWIHAGSPAGDPRDLPPLPVWPRGWQLGEPDIVVTLPQPFELEADGADVYRYFAVPLPINKPTFVRSWEFQPGHTLAIHHAGLGLDKAGATRKLDRQTDEPGFERSSMVGFQGFEGQFQAWNLGKQPFAGYDDIASRIDPGDDLMLELHLTKTGKTELIQPRIGLYFADREPTRFPSLLRIGPYDLNIAPNDKEHVVRDQFNLPVDVYAMAIAPHAHYLAKRMDSYAILPNGKKLRLLRIGRWNFDWQADYRYREPVTLPAGSTVHMEFSYDNSAENIRNPNQPPSRVFYGPQTSDEMCGLWLQLLPRDPADLQALRQAISEKDFQANLASWQRIVASEFDHPNRADAHYNIGVLHYQRAEVDQALQLFLKAVTLEDDHADAHNAVASVFLENGKIDLAQQHFASVAKLRPSDASAQLNLAQTHVRLEQWDEAVTKLTEATRLDPGYVNAFQQLAEVLITVGRQEEAADNFATAMRIAKQQGDTPTAERIEKRQAELQASADAEDP